MERGTGTATAPASAVTACRNSPGRSWRPSARSGGGRRWDDAGREESRALRRRIAELTPLLQETRELAALTARYYDRSYHRHERYTI